MTPDYGTEVAVPLVASLAVLALVTCALLVSGARRGTGQAPGQGFSEAFDEADDGRRWLLGLAIVTVVFLAANQLLVRGVAVGRWDADAQFYPYYVLVADHARAWSFVGWDPWSNAGLPALGDPQVGAFSPINVLLGLMTGGTSQGFRIYWLLMWWLGGAGMLLLGRHLGSPWWGACVVALGFLFCGVYTGNAEHTSWITAFSFLPLIIWRLDVALLSRRLRPAVEAGALWGLSALAGYPGIVLITGCFTALWALGRWLLGSPRLTPGFALTALGLVLLVGSLVLSPTYVAFFFEGAGTSARVGALAREVALSNALEPGALATFASPYLAALKVARQFMAPDVPPGELWPATDLSMVSIYAGAIIPVLALFGLMSRPRDGWRWWVAGLGVLSIGCAMGETLPLRGWLYDWLYPMRFFRHAAIFRLYFVFAICVLALMATRDLQVHLRQPNPSGPRRFLPASLLLAFCAVLATIPFLDPAWNTGMPEQAVLLGRLHFAWIWLGACTVALLGWQLPRRSRVWCVPVLLVALATSDALLTSVLSIPTTLRLGEAAERWNDLDRRHQPSLDLTGNGWWRQESACAAVAPLERCRSNDQLITKVPVFDAYTTDRNAFHQAMIHDPVLRGMATGAERLWFSRQVDHRPVSESSLADFRTRAEQLGSAPLVIHSPEHVLRGTKHDHASFDKAAPETTALARLPAAQRIESELVRYLPEELVFDVHPATDGWLLLTERWGRSWRAEVNGRQTTSYAGNFVFRALPLSAGPNRIRYTYHPAGYPWLIVASWGTLVAVGLGAGVSAMPRRMG